MELGERGCELKALNDRGDGSPEGELTDGILDQIAKFERAKIAERTRRGMLRKVREGNPNVTGRPRYGFRYNEAKDTLVIYEPEMRVVEKIFRMAAEGLGLNAMQGHLHAAGVLTATGKPVWDIQMIRRVIASDMYRPHSFEEVSGLVVPEVAARLDPTGSTGFSGTTASGSRRGRCPSPTATAAAVTGQTDLQVAPESRVDRHTRPRVPP